MATFTPRQIQLLIYSAKGMTAKQIGGLLGISHRTVEAHLAILKAKMKCTSKYELIQFAWASQAIREKILTSEYQGVCCNGKDG